MKYILSHGPYQKHEYTSVMQATYLIKPLERCLGPRKTPIIPTLINYPSCIGYVEHDRTQFEKVSEIRATSDRSHHSVDTTHPFKQPRFECGGLFVRIIVFLGLKNLFFSNLFDGFYRVFIVFFSGAKFRIFASC